MTAHEVFWQAGGPAASFTPLSGPEEADIVIIGGGHVGLLSAYLLGQAGRKVIVLEGRRVGAQATGKSTAKISSQHGAVYHQLDRKFGDAAARLYGQANQRAIGEITALCGALDIECGLESLPSFVYSTDPDKTGLLEREAEAAARLGLPARFDRDCGLPFPVAGAVRFDDQAQFDPYRFLQGLAWNMPASVTIHENTRVLKVDHGEPNRLHTEAGGVKARHVIVATQIPVVPEGLYFTKAYPIAHPVAAARYPGPLRGMYLSVDTPSHSVRTATRDGEQWLVAAGGQYRTGEEDAENKVLADLEGFLRDGFGISTPDYVWSNEDFRSMDDMPFVGRVSDSKSLYVATGFGAWGITNGMVAAHILADQVLGRQSEEADLFDASRLKPLHGGAAFLTGNLKAGAHLVGDKLLKRAVRDLDEIPPGEGGVIETEAGQTAVLRKADGTLAAVSASCTHMGCTVGWNPIDGTWDCPCHGSRFDADGKVLSGPATSPLEPRQVP